METDFVGRYFKADLGFAWVVYRPSKRIVSYNPAWPPHHKCGYYYMDGSPRHNGVIVVEDRFLGTVEEMSGQELKKFQIRVKLKG